MEDTYFIIDESYIKRTTLVACREYSVCLSGYDSLFMGQYVYTLRQNEVKGVYLFHLLHTSGRLSVRLCVDQIVSALYLPQYLPDPFHIYLFLQATAYIYTIIKHILFR